MDSDQARMKIREGADVIGEDGETLGKVDRVEGDMIVVQKGMFFPEDHSIPVSAVASVDDDNVYLSGTIDAVLGGEWIHTDTPTTEPGDTRDRVAAETTITDETVATGETGAVDRDNEIVATTRGVERDRDSDTLETARMDDTGTRDQDGEMEVDPEPFEHEQDTQKTHINEPDELLVPLMEEELVADTHPTRRGEVRISKRIVEEQEELEVPVTEDEVNVTRRRIDNPASVIEHEYEESTIEVPLHGEDIDIEKRQRVIEEIDVDKTSRTYTEHVTDTVQREELDIEGEDGVERVSGDQDRPDNDRT